MLKIGNYYRTQTGTLVKVFRIEVLSNPELHKAKLLYWAEAKDGSATVGRQSNFKAVNLKTCDLQVGDECVVKKDWTHRFNEGDVVKIEEDELGVDYITRRTCDGLIQFIPRKLLRLLPGF